MSDARILVHQLRGLGHVEAPASVLPSVLERTGHRDAYSLCDSPIGPVYVAYNGLGISAVLTADSAAAFEAAFQSRFNRPLRYVEALPESLASLWQQQWQPSSRATLPVDLRHLKDFERAVLEKAREIPRGEMRPYAWVAREVGHPKAVRAVGTALGHNPIPLLIPCHRVGKSDGHIGNYAFGAEAKQMILDYEGVDVAGLEQLARRGMRYYGSDTTHIYCFPTCRNARRITERHRVTFRSDAEATRSGYRPCKVCRPALAA
ncbi:methylated-DNA--[protein]-cysteine S-methyltransferase [Candidatus Entotheonella palauensis]|uniref:methylated-DNA--[protein]-cysteine S-methyltransferase n=1 Tax=Candidatus Entotheonella palauensis TaxID=93172 RepID=UPI000B7D6AE0|nr:methylated-DNA--[protein]-cysteine S-methyltransferase [Candidatus Entotheonella palauensis]